MNKQPIRIRTISEYHRMAGLPKPEHPLISVVNMEALERPLMDGVFSVSFDFYAIALKKDFHVEMKYGQQPHDYDDGVLHFMAPGQVITIAFKEGQVHKPTGWMVFFHPDFLWNTALAKNIRRYEYFSYSVNEALYLTEREETIITGITQNIAHEYHGNIDNFSQGVIIAQLELLLTYSERFYQRQFITRKKANHELLNRFEDLIVGYFASGALAKQGLPTVTYIAQSLNVSPGYLTALLKSLTGQSTQQHLHDKLIQMAKEKLSTTSLSVSEIAYELGFEHLASFSKLFKVKTHLSPLEFRQLYN